jgi:hypothetical protein
MKNTIDETLNATSKSRRPFPKVDELQIEKRVFNVTSNSSKVQCQSQFPFFSLGPTLPLSPVKCASQVGNGNGMIKSFQPQIQRSQLQGSEKMESKRSEFDDALQTLRHNELLRELRELKKEISEIWSHMNKSSAMSNEIMIQEV